MGWDHQKPFDDNKNGIVLLRHVTKRIPRFPVNIHFTPNYDPWMATLRNCALTCRAMLTSFISLSYSGTLDLQSLPSGLLHLEIGKNANSGDFRRFTQLQSLKFFNHQHQSVPLTHLPPSLLELRMFRHGYDDLIRLEPSTNNLVPVLPEGLTRLCITGRCHGELLPSTLTDLEVHRGEILGQNKLSTSLTRLSLIDVPPHDLDGLPNSLLYLRISEKTKPDQNWSLINRNRYGRLPPELEEFNLTSHNQYCDDLCLNDLPKSLKKLRLSVHKNTSLDNLPLGLTSLVISNFEIADNALDNLPDELENLEIFISRYKKHSLRSLPSKLTSLTLAVRKEGTDWLDIDHLLQKNGLKRLKLWDNRMAMTAPTMTAASLVGSRLTHLLVDKPGEVRFSKILPETLTHLTLGEHYNQPLNGLPSGLTHLFIGNHYNYGKKTHGSNLSDEGKTGDEDTKGDLDDLPTNLQHLVIGPECYEKINKFPKKLSRLVIGHWYQHPICRLPERLTYLWIGAIWHFAKTPLPVLPSSLCRLYLPETDLDRLSTPLSPNLSLCPLSIGQQNDPWVHGIDVWFE